MHPALSVILFSTLSGSGYGLLLLLGLAYAWEPLPGSSGIAILPFAFALVLATIGLIASLWHLGQPQRAWRAFSQWRSSWLSREGVFALATFVPALWLSAQAWQGEFGLSTRVLGIALVLLAAATIACTAMIYASLKPVAAWHNHYVLPGYLGFAILGGALWLGALLALDGWRPSPGALITVAALLVLLALFKLFYWRHIDRNPFTASAESATGLGAIGRVRSFEQPHTESNYLLREMGFVLARRHGNKLRAIALLLAFALPVLLLPLARMAPDFTAWWLGLAALSLQLGALVERWLFFAQARHTVVLYYRAGLADPTKPSRSNPASSSVTTPTRHRDWTRPTP